MQPNISAIIFPLQRSVAYQQFKWTLRNNLLLEASSREGRCPFAVDSVVLRVVPSVDNRGHRTRYLRPLGMFICRLYFLREVCRIWFRHVLDPMSRRPISTVHILGMCKAQIPICVEHLRSFARKIWKVNTASLYLKTTTFLSWIFTKQMAFKWRIPPQSLKIPPALFLLWTEHSSVMLRVFWSVVVRSKYVRRNLRFKLHTQRAFQRIFSH